MSRLWAGTKIVCLTVLSTFLLFIPQWVSIGTVAAVLVIGSLIGRVPLSALPRPGVMIWSGLVGALLGSWLGGNIWIVVRSLLVALLILWGSMLLVWTTPIDRLSSALHTLLRPLRLLRIPIDEWVTAVELALRGLPVMRDQTTAVADAARLRSGGRPPQSTKAVLRLGIDLVTACLSAASRRASDTGRALTTRGGVPRPELAPVRIGWRDGIVVAACALACVAMVVS